MAALGRFLNWRPSILLLVIVKPSSTKFRIIVPVPVATVTTLVEAVAFWGGTLGRLGGRWAKNGIKTPLTAEAASRRLTAGLRGLGLSSASSALEVAPAALERLWRELISHGSWSLVDAKTSGGDRIFVRFV